MASFLSTVRMPGVQLSRQEGALVGLTFTLLCFQRACPWASQARGLQTLLYCCWNSISSVLWNFGGDRSLFSPTKLPSVNVSQSYTPAYIYLVIGQNFNSAPSTVWEADSSQQQQQQWQW